MSKKKNKKSVKKKVLKKPAKKKAPKKAVKPVKKKTAKKIKPKKATKKIKPAAKKARPAKKSSPKKTVKKAAKKPAPKKALKKPVVKKVVAKKPAQKIALPKKPVIEIAKPSLKATNHTPHVEHPVALKQDVRKVVKVVKPLVKTEAAVSPRKSVVIDIKTGPEPAGRFELEYVVHASAQILFEFLTTPSGLSEWFCDDVNIRNGIYSFKWEENEQNARVVKLIEEKLVRFQWVDKHDNSYFEFRIERDDLTNDISLIIVDFAETPEERASSALLWNSQVDKLLHVLGAYF